MPEPEGGWASLWPLDPQVRFLNHGSFGACPRHVLDYQAQLRQLLERQPVEFLGRKLPRLLDEARRGLAGFLGCAADDLVFVRNATAGVNAVLRSLPLKSEDELVVTDHASMRLLRLSAQLYNRSEEYDLLREALKELL